MAKVKVFVHASRIKKKKLSATNPSQSLLLHSTALQVQHLRSKLNESLTNLQRFGAITRNATFGSAVILTYQI